MHVKDFVGCCGAYCKTCKPFISGHCKGCKLGYDDGKRDINKAKCTIKLCCLKDHHYDSCADCAEISYCSTIGNWYSKNGYKYKKYKEATDYIRTHGYSAFIAIADNWNNAYGKYH